jgi:putative transposase
MGGRPRYQVPAGFIARGWRFEVEATTSGQRSLIQQHFGARRFAHNWALAEVKANLNARSTDPSVQPLPWDLPSLRRAWNQAKNQVAPWWPCCSKEAYASGIADLVTGQHNWSASKNGRRAGRPVGFPRFKARGRDHGRVRFCTGAMRLESDRRHLILPVIGRLRCKENTRSLQRLLAKERARVLSMTLSEHGGRLFVFGLRDRRSYPTWSKRARRPLWYRPWHRSGVGGRGARGRHHRSDRSSCAMGCCAG